MEKEKVMDKVIVTNQFMGLLMMQVCAANNAADEEILDTCNTKNPAGTQNGWCRIIRTMEDALCDEENLRRNQLPVQCDKYSNRKHYLVTC